MAKRHFNWKLIIVLAIGFVVLATTSYGLRQWQRSRRADRGLILGNKAYDEQQWEEAARNLGRYLAIKRDDISALLKYAESHLHTRPLKQSNLQQGIAAYRTVLRIERNNSEAAMQLTKIYLEMNMPGEAELIAKRYLGRDNISENDQETKSQINQDPELSRILAVALARQRKFEEAAIELKNTLAEHPEQILVYETLGQLAEQRPQDFPEQASDLFDEALENNPSSALAYIIRAGFRLRRADGAGALADLELAEKLDLSDPLVRMRLAIEFINANITERAEIHLAAVQKVAPTNQALWRAWAQLGLKSQSKAKMLEIAETGLKELSSQPWDFIPIATELYIRCGEFGNADDCITKMRQKDITPATTAFLEGLLADQRGQGYEAVKHWYKAMQLGAEPTRTRLALASTLSRLGDKQSAIRQLHILVSEQPTLLNGRLNLVKLLIETGNWAQATEQAHTAMQTAPNSLEAALLYAQSRIEQLAENREDKDSEAWTDVKELLSNLEKTSDNLLAVKVLEVQLETYRSQFDQARQLLKQIKNNYPSGLELTTAEVELLTAQGNTDDAIKKLYEAVDESPESIGLLRYLAALLAGKGENEKSEKILSDCLARTEQPQAKKETGLLLAGFYRRWNEEQKCHQFLTSLVAELPEDITLQRELLRCKTVAEDIERAQKIVDRIKVLEGEEGWQWRYEQARVWFGRNDFKEHYPQIISLLKENLKFNPDDQASRTLLADGYRRAGESQLAISTYQDALNRSPQDIRIIISTVAALYSANEYERADQILRRAANEKLFHPELKKLELQSHLREGKWSSASNTLEELLVSDPNNQSICLSLALLKIRQNKYDEAEELLNKLRAQEPNSLPITAAQIELKVREGKTTEALKICDDITEVLKEASVYILRARTYAMIGESQKAEEDFERAIMTEPNNAQAWTAKSDFHRSVRNYDKAITSIQKAASLEPDNLAIRKRAISLYLSSGERDRILQGKATLEKTLAANPEDAELRLYKTRLLLNEGTTQAIKQATGILEDITEEQPHVAEAWTQLAQIALAQGQSGKALDTALKGLAHRSNDKSLLLLKAQAEAARSPSLAIPTLKALQELDPNDADITINLANTYIASGNSEQAVKVLKKYLADCNNSQDRKVRIVLAAALNKNGNKEESTKEFESLLKSAPNDPSPLLAYARLLKDDELWGQLNRKVTEWYEKHSKDIRTPITIANELAGVGSGEAQKTAEEILRMILENDSDCAEAIISLALLLQTTDRPMEAANLYQQILKLQPDNIIAMNNLAWIMCEQYGKYQQALELTQRGLQKAPNYVDLIDTRGVVYYKLGQYDNAVRDFSRCLEMYPHGTAAAVSSHLHLGKALAKLGQRHEAIESLKKVLELNSELGALSHADATEAQRLIEELSRGV